jgi:hypothetical protein
MVEEDFPEGDLRESWESIEARLTALKEPPPSAMGDVRYTLDRMNDEDAVALANGIVELCFACRWEETEQEIKKATSRRR